MKTLSAVLGTGAGILLVGCASVPTMKYATYGADGKLASGTDADGSIKFYLYGSAVTLVAGTQGAAPAATPAGDKSKNPDPSTQAAAILKAAKPVAVKTIQDLKNNAQAVVSKKVIDTTLYAMVPDESFHFKPNISVTYYPNSYAVKTIGAAAQDTQVQIIQAVGGIVTALLPLLAHDQVGELGNSPPPPAASTLNLPTVIDLTALDFGGTDCVGDPSKVAKWCPIVGTSGDWVYLVNLHTRTSGTKDTTAFFAGAVSTSVRVFPAPVCQNITLSVALATDLSTHMDFDLTVADPQRLATYLVPAKGSISPGDVCGADTSVSAAEASSTSDVMNALSTQVSALQKAIQSKDSGTNSAKPKT